MQLTVLHATKQTDKVFQEYFLHWLVVIAVVHVPLLTGKP